jgi:uncharacterized membrane protein
MPQLVKQSFAGLLMIVSVVLGLLGAGAVVGSLFMFASPAPFPLALVTAVVGLAVFAGALGLMAWARHLSAVPNQVGMQTRMPNTASRALRIVLMFASVVLIYMGVSTLLSLAFSLLGHAPADSAVAVRVALGVGGIALLAIGVAAMRGARNLPRRGPG